MERQNLNGRHEEAVVISIINNSEDGSGVRQAGSLLDATWSPMGLNEEPVCPSPKVEGSEGELGRGRCDGIDAGAQAQSQQVWSGNLNEIA
jgi:hypothetical protein